MEICLWWNLSFCCLDYILIGEDIFILDYKRNDFFKNIYYEFKNFKCMEIKDMVI